jgi:hypothetical protein
MRVPCVSKSKPGFAGTRAQEPDESNLQLLTAL